MEHFKRVISILLFLSTSSSFASELLSFKLFDTVELSKLQKGLAEFDVKSNPKVWGVQSLDAMSCFERTNTLSYKSYLTSCEEERTEFQKQYDICTCINARSLLKTPEMYSGHSWANNIMDSPSYKLTHLKNIINDFSAKSTYTHNMMILYAQSMGAENAVKYNLDKPVSVDEGFISFVKDNIKQNLGAAESDLSGDIDKLLAESHVGEKTTSVVNVLKGEEVEGELCIPMKDYLMLNSFPQDNLFWGNLKPRYAKDDWDIQELNTKFIRAKTDEEKRLIGTKIEFLEKNPFVKLVFNSSDTAAAEKVYSVMSKHMSGIRCTDKVGSCHEKFIMNKLGNYKDEMTKVFERPEMVDLIQKEREIDTKRQIATLLPTSSDMVDLKTLNDWSRSQYNVSMQDCTTNNENTFGFTPNIGLNFTAKLDSEVNRICLEKMPQYCREVGTDIGSVLSAGNTNGLISLDKTKLNDLYESISNDLDADPATNGRYQRDAGQYCNNHFRYHNGKSVNFGEFKQANCEGSQPAQFCADRSSLAYAFFQSREDKNRNEDNPHYGIPAEVISGYLSNKPDIADLRPEDQKKFQLTEGAGGSAFSFLKSDQVASIRSLDKSNEGLVDSNSFFSDIFGGESSSESSIYHAPALQNNSAFNSSFHSALGSVKDAKDEVDEEIRVTKEAIRSNKERLTRSNTTPEFRSDVEGRVKMLENLLAEKEKSSQQYQELIAKLIEGNKSQQQSTSQRLASTSKKSNVIEDEETSRMVASSGVRSGVPTQAKNNEDLSRGPASVAENFSTSGGVKGGGAGAVGFSPSLGSSASASGRGTLNSALLSKYGITVQESDNNVQIAPDKERGQISRLLTNASKSDIGLEVSKVDYDKYKNLDLSALNRLYEERIEMLNTDVVKLMIHAEGVDESLEFYAIKEDGKVVFQPVRKTRLTDLQNALNQ